MRLSQIEISKIDPNPDNPRGIDIPTEDKELGALKDSIAAFGVMVPIVVTPKGNRFFLIDGERRYHAAKSVGLTKLPAYIIEKEDGRAFTPNEMLFRMCQIHHLREQWKAIQQCRALEHIYHAISTSPEIRSLPNERSRIKAAVELLAAERRTWRRFDGHS